ncbi:Small-conductance mechanosensitive channel [Spraguea lophii 42_110]|uniref:Small-conductance mechanosensitive channel n=1 Tax=Spraguea lophii (strain 42_110) TaxID=1358809 RepID=S7XSC6_SPRLO|nr:Small-conductance mechanosensitive channel [Spraguea lophii 42_110]
MFIKQILEFFNTQIITMKAKRTDLIVPFSFGMGLLSFKSHQFIKDIFTNTLKSLYFYMSKPFSIGDKIKISGKEGTVQDINYNYIVLRKKDGYVYIPIFSLFSSVIEVNK